MSYELAVWEGPPPLSNAHAASECQRLLNAGSPQPATPAIHGFVDALLAVHPDHPAGPDDGPWGAVPLLDNAEGPMLYFGVQAERIDEVLELVETTAAKMNLVAFDPQLGQLLPSATSIPRLADFELPAAADLPLHLNAIMGEALAAPRTMAGILEQVETGFYVQWMAADGALILEAQGEQRLAPEHRLAAEDCHRMEDLGFVAADPNWRLEFADGVAGIDAAAHIITDVVTGVRHLGVGTPMALQTFPL